MQRTALFHFAFVLVFLLMFGGLPAQAKAPVPQATSACSKSGARVLLNLELSEEQRAEAASQHSLVWRLPSVHCVRTGQDLSLSRRNAKNQTIVWGRARLTLQNESSSEIHVRVEVTPLLLERTLAPDGLGLAEVLLQLPVNAVPHVRIDLRTGEGPRFEVPDARPIPFEDVSRFAFEKLPLPGPPLVLIMDSPDLRNAGIFDLLRELRLRGYMNLYWYYPGAQGLKNFYALFPAESPPTSTCGDRVLDADEAAFFEREEMRLLPRALPTTCAPGDTLRLIRFEKPAETAFVIGLARILRVDGAQTLVQRLWFDPRETGWIAWIGLTNRLDVETQPAPADSVKIRRPEEAAKVQSASVEIPAATALWRGALETLREKRQTRPALRVFTPTPPLSFDSLPGVIDISPERHTDLRITGAIIFRPASLPWRQGSSIVRTPQLRGVALREKLALIREPRPESDALVILSEGIHDTDAPKLARELLALGYRRIYWDRGASLPAPRKIRFDPVPPTH